MSSRFSVTRFYKGEKMRNFRKSERGSVMLEFCLVLPIYLLIFGGTFLLFDLSMARLHLQEANRNLAWIQDDRFDTQGLINQRLYKKVKEYYDVRNALEQKMSSEPMWGFGTFYAKYAEKKQDAEANKQQNGSTNESAEEITLPWGQAFDTFKENDVELNINNPWASNIGGMIEECLKNGFLTLHTGNMELTMDKVSATYIGAVGVSSVLFPSPDASGQETVPLYGRSYKLTRARYELTRARYEGEPAEGTETTKIKTTKINGEMLIIRRTSEGEKRESENTDNENTDNRLTPLAPGSETWNILFGAWPSNGKLGDISILLGVGL